MDPPAQATARARLPAHEHAEPAKVRAAPGKTQLPPTRPTGASSLGFLDARTILTLQASAGNAAVASLLQVHTALQRQPVPAVAPPAGPPAVTNRQAIINKLHEDSRAAAQQIREILTGNSYLGSRNQAQIMDIARPWAKVQAAPNSNMSGMDWLIAGLRQQTYEVGWVVNQTTSAFDELYHRMDKENVAEFQRMVEESGKQFKNDKPVELAKFEVSQEDIIRGLKAGGELAAALATGGGSIVLQVIAWLADTLPGLWSQLKAVFSLIDAVKGFRSSGVGSKFSEPALGALAVEGLFGEVSGLPVLGGKEPPKAEESGEASQSGLTKVLMMIVHGITVVKGAYNKIATKVNGIIHSIDISKEEWLPDVAAIYAGITQAKHLVEDPMSAFKMLVDKAKEMVGGFFDKITGHIGEVVGGITEKLGMIVQPVKLIGHLADRLVSTVLNFIITHPPSALLQTVFQVVQTAAGVDLIDLVRQKLKPIGDEIIEKIANSHVVQTAIEPIKEPVHKISEAIGKVVTKGLDVVKGVQARVAEFLNPEKLKELTHLGTSVKQPAPVAETTAAPTDFLGAIKEGLHSRLMILGNARLIALAKTGAKFVWGKIKAGAKAAYEGIKGMIIGEKLPFKSGGEDHEIWVEQQDEGPVVMVASEAERLERRLQKLNDIGKGKDLSQGLKDHLETWTETIGQYLAEVKERPKNRTALQEIAGAISRIEDGITGVKGERPATHLIIDMSDVIDEDYGTDEENDLVKWSWDVKKEELWKASDAGKLRWSPGTSMVRDTGPQQASQAEDKEWYHQRYDIVIVSEKFVIKTGKRKGQQGTRSRRYVRELSAAGPMPPDHPSTPEEAEQLGYRLELRSSLQADHPVDLVLGGSPDQPLKLIHAEVNNKFGSRIARAGKEKGLKWGDQVFISTYG